MPSYSEKQISKLQESIDWSIRQLKFPRNKRLSNIKELVGFHYSDYGSDKHKPVNMYALSVLIHMRLLAPKTPNCIISTRFPELKPTAANLTLAVNQIPEEINLEDTLQMAVLEALVSHMGIVKVGLAKSGLVLGHEYGTSFVDNVSLDDYFCDMSAKRDDLMDYEGNDYWVDFEELMESGEIGKKSRDIEADEYTLLGNDGEQRAESISVSESAKTFKDKILLRDVYIPSDKVVITYAAKSKKIIKTVDWKEPKGGPYKKLRFQRVPGNLLPLSPSALWLDIDEISNKLMRKLSDGAILQKKIYGFGDDEPAELIKKTEDGGGFKMTAGQEPKEVKIGGLDQNTLAFLLQTRNLASYFANNLDTLGGLGIQAQTVGQERLLSEASGAQLRTMADRTIKFIKEIFRDLAYYEWTDPIKKRTLDKPIPGLKETLTVEFGRDHKIGKFDQYSLDIDVFSAQDDSPSTLLQKLSAFIKEYVMPLAPMAQQDGGRINYEKILDLAITYSNFDELRGLIEFPDQPQTMSSGGEVGMPQNTTRTYERVGRPGMSKQGEAAAMTQMLMGGDPGGAS
jgi:hypothetical protein